MVSFLDVYTTHYLTVNYDTGFASDGKRDRSREIRENVMGIKDNNLIRPVIQIAHGGKTEDYVFKIQNGDDIQRFAVKEQVRFNMDKLNYRTDVEIMPSHETEDRFR